MIRWPDDWTRHLISRSVTIPDGGAKHGDHVAGALPRPRVEEHEHGKAHGLEQQARGAREQVVVAAANQLVAAPDLEQLAANAERADAHADCGVGVVRANRREMTGLQYIKRARHNFSYF